MDDAIFLVSHQATEKECMVDGKDRGGNVRGPSIRATQCSD